MHGPTPQSSSVREHCGPTLPSSLVNTPLVLSFALLLYVIAVLCHICLGPSGKHADARATKPVRTLLP